jgi:hypothetical protein
VSEDLAGRGIRATIKYGKGYDETWVSFTGTPDEVRLDIVEYFGFPSDEAGLSLNELVIKATQIAHGIGLIATTLGGVPIPAGNGPDGQPAPPWKTGDADEGQQPAADAWAQAEGNPAAAPVKTSPAPTNPNEHLYRAVEEAATIDALKRVWAGDQAAFAADSVLMQAYKARGKALTELAKASGGASPPAAS